MCVGCGFLPKMSKTSPRVSVVVPVFNTEPYLARCLNSLLDSTLTDIEIICVDDASTDASAKIVADFARRDARVRLIRHDCNRGLGPARNTGIAAARSAYVGGVDSDDWVATTMFERLLEATDGGRVDVVEGGYIQIDAAGNEVRSYRPAPRTVDNDGNRVNIFAVTRPAYYTKLWRRSLFVDNDIWFPERIYFEDLATTPRLLAKCRLIRFIEDAGYFWLKRDGSITYSASDRHLLDYFRAFDVLLDFLQDNDLLLRYEKQFVVQMGKHLTFHAGNVLDFDGPEADKLQYLRYLLMMTRGYQESFAELQGASCDDLVALFRADFAHEKATEASRLIQTGTALAAEVPRLDERVAALERGLAAQRQQHRELTSDPVWRATAPLRRLGRAARRLRRSVTKRLGGSLNQTPGGPT
jgi:glycosyltransferase involved in cell wall biosynthesis